MAEDYTSKFSGPEMDVRLAKIPGLETVLSGKQDAIPDLQTIRSGAAAGVEAAVRPYDSENPNGMGYLVLEKDKTFAEQVTAANTIYEIRYDFVLASNFTMPANCTLRFNGGSVSGAYTLSGNNTRIDAAILKIFDTDVKIDGNWMVDEAYPEWFGAKGDGTTDDTDAIRCSIKLAYCGYGSVIFGDKIYIVTPNMRVDWNVSPAAKTMYAAFIMKSNLSFKGSNSTIKVSDNFCTPTNIKNFSIFFTNEKIENVSFVGITFDCNGANNRCNTTYNHSAEAPINALYNCHHVSILVSSIYNKQDSARLNNLNVDRCSFINTSGVTSIGAVSANTTTTDTEISKNWVIKNCLFKNNGLDSADHSSIYAQADDVLCVNNVFCNDVTFPNGFYTGQGELSGAFCPYEVHGDNQKFLNNTVINYRQALWITPAGLRDTIKNIIIGNNSFIVQVTGIITKCEYADNILITNNLIEINGAATIPGSTVRDCVSFNAGTSLTNLMVINNVMRGTVSPDIAHVAVSLYSGCSSIIKGNTIEKVTEGLRVAIGSVPLLDTEFCENTLHNMYSSNGRVSTGVFFVNAATAKRLLIKNNSFKSQYDDSPINYGVYLRGDFEKVTVKDNENTNVTTPLVRNNVTSSLGFDIDQSSTYTPYWRCGTTGGSGTLITVGNGTLVGECTLIGKSVFFSTELVIGSTTVLPEGLIRINLPFAIGSLFEGFARIKVQGVYHTRRVVGFHGNTLIYMEDEGTNQGGITSTAPFQFVAGDFISVTGHYFIS